MRAKPLSSIIHPLAAAVVMLALLGPFKSDLFAAAGDLLATLSNPDPDATDQFGFSVDISGNLAVVGARDDDPGGVSNAGTAYVFNASTGALVATLSNPDPDVLDLFGLDVAISGNLAVVGAHLDDPGGVGDAGTAYVFNASTGALVATLSNPDPVTLDLFGAVVDISGNLAIVGAQGDDPGGVADVGSAYVFDATTGALVTTLSNPDPDSVDEFGVSVAISGNLAIVGAWFDDPGGIGNAGTAYVFDATTGAHVATLSNPDPDATDHFGFSVDISGNLAVVGAFNDDPGGVADVGSAYVFDATTGAHLVTLSNPEATTADLFGYQVAISGNVAVVGAIFDDPGGVGDAGSGYVFDATTGTHLLTLPNPDPGVSDVFGISVAISGNLAVIGASGDDPGGVSNSGTAYVFEAPSLGNTPAGLDVEVHLEPEDAGGTIHAVWLIFDEVLTAGDTIASISDMGPEPPVGFRLGTPNIYWTLSTDAVLAGGSSIEVCLDYSAITFGSSPESLFLAQADEFGAWIDITSSLDAANNMLCGTASGFSEFAILEVADPFWLLNDLADTVALLNLNKGISNALDSKLEAVEQAIADTSEENDLAALHVLLDAFINSVEAQRGKELTDAEADELIARAEEIALVLSGDAVI